ncbi:DUF4339 domain-containing protein [Antarcticirhabdus aurantiaca]|uniref:GYF domain-containing protein n=1 Tax=Antarcticirhabdus aurantiaca TaxID=2606717 RepID=A0ACD4NRZ5_9HYPH|nr:GYF domain-containing protein [Antarcticirhabdus aurantiaca]WAJ29507.1 GYF domain-containing protein [Jeongeuplla avenae]
MTDNDVPNGTTVTAMPQRDLRPIGGPPPHPLDAEWYMLSNGQSYGPYTGHRMKELMLDGRLDRNCDVVRVGTSEWIKAGDDAALSTIFPPAIPTVQPAQSAGHVTAERGSTVVQVTNHIDAPRPQVILLDGEAKAKSAGLAFVLSFLITGLGQCYNGQVGKGVLMFVGTVFLWFFFLGWIIMIWSWFDAYGTAKKMNRRYEQRLAAAGVVL